MATDMGQIAVIAWEDRDSSDWVRQKEAADFLGVDPRTVHRLAEQGKIRSGQVEGMERGLRYCLRDLEGLKRYGVELGGITLYLKDGAPSLSRRMPAIPEESLVERLDRAWRDLLYYRMIRGAVAEKIRCNVAYAVMKARRKDRSGFACLSTAVPPEDE